MNFSFWSDEERLFVPRLLGWSINFKLIARKLGWIKPRMDLIRPPGYEGDEASSESRVDRLRRAIEQSRHEGG